MTHRIICLLIAASAMGLGSLSAQEGAATTEGILTFDKKIYTVKRGVAYETKIDDEDAIAVVLGGQAVTSEELAEARKKEKEGGDPNFKRPFLRMIFTTTGQFKHWSAAAGGTMIGRHSGKAMGEVKIQDGQASGKASQAFESEGILPMGFDARFAVPLIKAGESLPPSNAKKGGPAANVKPTVTGLFRGNGKEASLAFVTARWVEPFAGKPGIELTFTEKAQAKEKKPGFDAMFGKLGSALILSLHEDGQIYSCQVVHKAHEKQGFSSVGQIEATEFAYENGKVEGEISTNGELDTFGEKWEVKIKFIAPLGEIPKEFQVIEEKKPVEQATPASSDLEDNDEPAEAASNGPKAKELALTKDASEVEYKALVGHLVFKSKANVKSVCTELTAGLKAQGWKADGSDLITPQSAILKRKLEKATLTIFVKPDGGGSEVKMMTEGLSWD